jgi:hypothetical protein
MQSAKSSNQSRDGDPSLEPSQGSSDAEMRAAAEPKMRVGASEKVEALGVIKDEGVVVGRSHAQDDDAPGWDGLPADLDGLQRDALGHVHGPVVTQ